MKNYTRIFDFILSRTVIFALAFIWFRYYLDSFLLTCMAAAGITVGISFIIFLVTAPKARKAGISGAEKQHMKEVINQFMYSENNRNIEYFYNIIKNEYPSALLPGCIITENDRMKTLIFTRFTFSSASPDDIREAVIECRRYNVARAVIFCNSYSLKAKEISSEIEGFEIILMDAANTYRFIKEFNMYPVIEIKTAKKTHRAIKVLYKTAFSRAKVKAYLFGAVIMLLGSFFVRYNLYYLISATVFLFFALICLIDFKFKKEIERNLL